MNKEIYDFFAREGYLMRIIFGVEKFLFSRELTFAVKAYLVNFAWIKFCGQRKKGCYYNGCYQKTEII